MNKYSDELKKKIVDVLRENIEYELHYFPDDNYTEVEFDYDKLAKALIAAGIGDVSKLQRECSSKEDAYNECHIDYKHWKHEAKEYKHRAEVLRLALSKSVLDENRIFDDDVCRYILSNTKLTEEYYIEQAEKELAEEKKWKGFVEIAQIAKAQKQGL